MTKFRAVLAWTALSVVAAACSSDEPFTCRFLGTPADVAARPSPFDSVTAHTAEGSAKLCYSKPSARDRVVFGNLVQFDTLWRTGANEATVLHLTSDATVAGVPVEAGKYSIYTVPRVSGEWTLVVNASTDQWGLTQDAVGADGNQFYNAYTPEVRAQEVSRVAIDIDSIDFVETLTASFDTVGGGVDLWVDWERTRVVVPIRFTPPEG